MGHVALNTPHLNSCTCTYKNLQEGQHPLTGQRAPPISGGT